MSNLVLSAEERKDLCGGYERPSFQKKRLHELGIPYAIGRDGYPVVLRADAERPPRSDAPSTKPSDEPRLSGVGFRAAS